MSPSSVRLAAVAGIALLAAAPAHAQRREEYIECFRDGRRVSCEDSRDARERALARARDARERALERQREERERTRERQREARERAEEAQRRAVERQREVQRAVQRQRELEHQRTLERQREILRERLRSYPVRRHWRDETRTTFGVGGGADIRRFADANRYFGNAAVDFHSRSGLGIRPEVTYAWSDLQRQTAPAFASTCTACGAVPPVVAESTPVEFRSRSQMLGVTLNGTYTLARGSFVRPYLIGGVGVLSTRETRPVVASSVPLASTPSYSQLTYRLESADRVDLGLNAGSGMEFGRGPVRLYVEFRYFLNDTPSPLGFSGALPITAGLRF